MKSNKVYSLIESGILKFNTGYYKAAIEEYNKALEIDPNSCEAYLNRSLAQYNLGEFQESISDCNKVIELNPLLAVAYYNRGIAKVRLGNKKGGALDFKKAGKMGIPSALDAVKQYC